tara:strand:+ start:566 stop:790 length:225 start_codon:yes stop_codon:yes gene_type:complete
MKKNAKIDTWIQGLDSEHYLSRQPITGQWNNSGDEILKKMHLRRERARAVAIVKGLGLVGAGAALAVLAGWAVL